MRKRAQKTFEFKDVLPKHISAVSAYGMSCRMGQVAEP